MQNHNYNFINRLIRVIFKKYPYYQFEEVDHAIISKTYHNFYKEKLCDIVAYNKHLKEKKYLTLSNISSLVTILAFFLSLFLIIFPEKVKLSENTTILIVVILNLALVTFYSLIIILIWNEKKNYSYYYENLITQHVAILENKCNCLETSVDNLEGYNKFLKVIISQDIHFLNEKIRDLDFYTSKEIGTNSNKINKILQEYLDKLCTITNTLYREDNSINNPYYNKYSSCIKLIHPEDIFSQQSIEHIRFKTLVRSSLPNTKKYCERIKDIGGRFDGIYELINDNDNLKILVEKKEWYYYINDFNKFYHDENFKTSHPHSTKYYQSSVVFPIIHRVEDNKAFILGFLCFENELANAFPSCSNQHDKNVINKIWEEFCCSQLDILSIILSKIIGWNEDKNSEVNNLLKLGKLREIKPSA